MPLLSNVILSRVSVPLLVVYGNDGVVVEYKHGIQLVSSIDGKVIINIIQLHTNIHFVSLYTVEADHC